MARRKLSSLSSSDAASSIIFSKQLCLDGKIQAAEVMQQEGVFITRGVAYSLLNECTKHEDYNYCKRVQFLMVHSGLQSIAGLADHLIRLFASCGELNEANQAFSSVSKPSCFTWNAIICAHGKLGEGNMTVYLYDGMQRDGIKPDKFTFLGLMKACTRNIATIEQCKHVHEHIIENKLLCDVMVGSALVDMYLKCGGIIEARITFDILPNRNVVSWNAMIAGYAQCGKGRLALDCLQQMEHDDIKPTEVTFLSILKACAGIGAIEQGKDIHKQITRSGLESIALRNTLIDMYAKCGCLVEAHEVFDTLLEIDVVTWNAMIAGYVLHDVPLLALACFEMMQRAGIDPVAATFLGTLKASGSIGAVAYLKRIHELVIENDLQFDIVVGSTLVDMYAKHGKLEEARKVFDSLLNRDVISWNAMIAGYGQHGEVDLALQSFEIMLSHGTKPDAVTFISILAACGRAGLVDQGRQYFTMMRDYYGIEPGTLHINCMVDLLGRAGCFKEVEDLLQTTVEPNIYGWMALLSACKVHRDVEFARHCFNEVIRIDSNCGAAYVLMSNIYRAN